MERMRASHALLLRILKFKNNKNRMPLAIQVGEECLTQNNDHHVLPRNADQMPRIFNERTVFAPLVQGILRRSIWFCCYVQKSILDCLLHELGSELSLGSLRIRYTSPHLQPLLRDLVCPVTRMVRNFVLSRQLFHPDDVPGPEEAVFHGNLANLVAS